MLVWLQARWSLTAACRASVYQPDIDGLLHWTLLLVWSQASPIRGAARRPRDQRSHLQVNSYCAQCQRENPRWIWGAKGKVGTKMAQKLGCRKMFWGGDENDIWEGNWEYLKGAYSKRWERPHRHSEATRTETCTETRYRQQIRVNV